MVSPGRWIRSQWFDGGILVLLAVVLHLVGRRVLGPPPLGPGLLRLVLVSFSLAVFVMQHRMAGRLRRAAGDAVPRAVGGAVRSQAVEALRWWAVAAAAWAPLVFLRGPWPVLYGWELAGAYLATALGFTIFSLRVQLSLAGRFAPWVRLGAGLGAAIYAVLLDTSGVHGTVETLVLPLVMGAALGVLGLNRLVALDPERLRRFR